MNEFNSNFCSGTSWTSNHCTSRLSYRSDNESLDLQLDRLNQTLQGVLKQEENLLTDSFSFRIGDRLDSEESFIERFENFLLKYDRSLMICEDFRSMELEKSQNNCKKISLKDLCNFKAGLESSIEMLENGFKDQVSIQSPLNEFTWTVTKEDFLPYKIQISESFKKNWEKISKKDEKIYEEAENSKLDQLMQESFKDQFLTPCQTIEVIVPKDLHSQISLEIEYKTLKNSNKLKAQTINNLEWERVQTKMLSSNLNLKQKILTEKENSLKKQVKDIQSEVIKKQKTMESEKNKYIEMLKKVKNQQKTIFDTLNEIQKPSKPLNIQTDFQVLTNRTNYCSPNSETIKKPDDFLSIEQEISLLEQQLPNEPDKNSLLFKINHLKTKLSTMRSAQALKVQVQSRRSSGINRLRVNTPIAGKLDFSALNLTPRDQIIGMKYNEQDTSRMHTERNMENTENKNEKEENWTKMLELKENRLRKKEQELILRENQIQNSLKNLPGTGKALQVLKESVNYWKSKNLDLEKRESELEKVFKENLDMKESLKASNARVDQLRNELDEKMENFNRVLLLVKEVKAIEV